MKMGQIPVSRLRLILITNARSPSQKEKVRDIQGNVPRPIPMLYFVAGGRRNISRVGMGSVDVDKGEKKERENTLKCEWVRSNPSSLWNKCSASWRSWLFLVPSPTTGISFFAAAHSDISEGGNEIWKGFIRDADGYFLPKKKILRTQDFHCPLRIHTKSYNRDKWSERVSKKQNSCCTPILLMNRTYKKRKLAIFKEMCPAPFPSSTLLQVVAATFRGWEWNGGCRWGEEKGERKHLKKRMGKIKPLLVKL